MEIDSQDPDVLIVGAGPTGLIMACQLLKLGVRFRIIDKLKDRIHESRAFAIQSRSMEIFQNLGLSAEVIKLARCGVDFAFFINGKKQIEIKLTEFPDFHTPFPSVYFLPQNELERILIQFLEKKGGYIEREKELLLFSQNNKEIEAVIKNKHTETIENIHCAYLIGCDGAHSTVRHKLDLPFEGASYKQSFILADASVSWPFPENKFLLFLNKQGIFAHIPLTKIFSLIILAPRASANEKLSTPTLIDIENIAQRVTKKPIKLTKLIWLVRFHLHHRSVQAYRRERVFLAGDAAHIHSPVGGQGMNTGIQDVSNLAWKLAIVIKNGGPDILLDTYNTERLRIGNILLKTTDRFFYFITTKNFFIAQLRNWLLPKLLALFFSKKNMARHLLRFISQLYIHYHSNQFVYEISKGADSAFKKGPQAGYRAPDAPLNSSTLFSLFSAKPFHLLIFQSKKSTINSAHLKFIENTYIDWIHIHRFTPSLNNKTLFQRYGVTASALYIIRPDGYIGFRLYGHNLSLADNYLRKLFEKTASN
jgi:2-polyprenyl-6-methoxyphenol hydroxylase-like FAD-dependent oxidoreductase